ncbi:Double-stranded RNA-binding protein 2 [Striga hermonthica]|uniref:Double-stranded RNA-binding protein 2 n=1 Tax=Striga hermonthica TaxID=68872 RepID=A0A9N7MSA8_STRHE|nr:Double-stranded RNA-binding protein 2 [Striga hermonthica]
MYKNQLQELAQRSCFNLPSYTCIREGPDHAPRFKASVNFNGETYESPSYCSTLRQAEHSAAEVALNAISSGGPTSSLAARILDETGVYKNLLQEVSQRVGGCMPSYTTFRSGRGHLPVFTCTVELVGVLFTGDPAKSKKQAEKNAAMVAWLSLKSLAQQSETPFEKTHKDEQEHVTVARALQKYLIKARLARLPFPIKFPTVSPRPSSTHHSSPTSKILPLICPKMANCSSRPASPATSKNSPTFQKNVNTTQTQPVITTPTNESCLSSADNFKLWAGQKFPAASAPPYIPVRHSKPHGRVAPLVTIRNMVPVFSAPPPAMRPPAIGVAPPVSIRQAVPVYAAPVCKDLPMVHPVVKADDRQAPRLLTAKAEGHPFARAAPVPNSEVPAGQVGLPSSETITVPAEPVAKVCGPPVSLRVAADKTRIAVKDKLQESKEIEDLKHLKI